MNTQTAPIATAGVRMARTQYQTIVSSGHHTLIADEPESMQGTDTGMAPFGLLLASLGSCTSITLRMYIERKMWIVDEILIDLAIYKVEGGTLITRNIEVKGNVTEEQKKRLEQIADACPIHKVLVGNVMVETKMA
ncbi:OsmC family protein [Mucilaginibacter koreensis]